MSIPKMRDSLVYWRERRAWVADMQPDNHRRVARIDCLIAGFELVLAGAQPEPAAAA